MLRVLLVFTTFVFVYGKTNCPAFSAFSSYPNKNSFLSKLTDDFLTVYTSAPMVHCHRGTYIFDTTNNSTVGYIQSPGCCVKIDNFDFNSNLNQLDYTVGPISGYMSSCPLIVNESGSMKLLSTTGSGNSICLILAVCQPDYYGLVVMCRGQAPLLVNIISLLFNVLGLLQAYLILALRSVNQIDCAFPSNNCPSF